MRIIAIDPGYERIGIAILEKTNNQKETVVYSDCFKTSAKLPFYDRLILIGTEISRVIDEFLPKAMAVETLFFSTNQKTAMQVSEARGVIIHEACRKGLKIFEHNPMEIKLAVTGDGKSDKTNIIRMIPMLVKITKEIKHDDEYDAVAVGLTCFAVNMAQLRD